MNLWKTAEEKGEFACGLPSFCGHPALISPEDKRKRLLIGCQPEKMMVYCYHALTLPGKGQKKNEGLHDKSIIYCGEAQRCQTVC